MNIYITDILNCQTELKNVIRDCFGLSESVAILLNDEVVKPHISQLRDDISVVIETDYVDRVYRDSFYNYYSSKFNDYRRDCIKVSLFNTQLNSDGSDFRSGEKVDELRKKYLGFFVIRPTEPQIIGRSVISPAALKFNNILTCTAYVPSTTNSIKFDAIGFPHSSQDSETISCAETTIWAVMEYFSNKYSEYKPTLPSQVLKTLMPVSTQRQLPSDGLQVEQISYALRAFGLGTKIYSRRLYKSEFDNLLSCYIESGIPLIVALDNSKYVVTNPGTTYIGHAVLCTGHVTIDDNMIDSLKRFQSSYSSINDLASQKNIEIYDWNDIKKEFVFIDDNHPIYQRAFLDTPVQHYTDTEWHGCEISHFIVPLHQRVYLEAFQAKNFVLGFLLENGPYSLPSNLELTIRTFLTSSRSYKQYIAINDTIPNEVKVLILEQKMPKFIWISELSNKSLLKGHEANGLVIVDATEPNCFNFEPLLLAFHSGFFVKYFEKERRLEKISLNLPPFSTFQSNLKHVAL